MFQVDDRVILSSPFTPGETEEYIWRGRVKGAIVINPVSNQPEERTEVIYNPKTGAQIAVPVSWLSKAR